MTTYRLDLAYDGSGFRGYARQSGVRTVQGELEQALYRMTGPVKTVVAGRTDAGVHAAHQVVSFATDRQLDTAQMVKSLNSMLSDEVAVLSCVEVEEGFSARFSATLRGYEYRILNRVIPDPFRRLTHWHVARALDLEAMRRAEGHFVGQHDFASFCRKAPNRTTERTVLRAAWRQAEEDVLVFHIEGLAFCHQMVRSIVDTCVAVGHGAVDADDIPTILAARNRNAAPGGAAPSCGLSLVRVSYDPLDADPDHSDS